MCSRKSICTENISGSKRLRRPNGHEIVISIKRRYKILKHYACILITKKMKNFQKPTSLLRASEALFRSTGSIARSVSTRGRAEGGNSLKSSLMLLLYGSRGLNRVALGNFDFFQYSSEGEPQSLYILCSCSTCVKHSTHGDFK